LRVKGRLVYLLDDLGGLLWEVPQEALQDGPGDVLFELGFVHGWAARALRHHRIENIIVGEGCEHSDTFKAFKIAGADTRKERWSVKLVDLYKDEFIEVRPSDSLALEKVKVSWV
jgi:hypothetical protein